MIAHWLGWIATIILLSEFFTLLARKFHLKKLAHFRGKHHMVWGKIVLAIVFIHGIIASIGSSVILFFTGALSGILLLFLVVTYYCKEKFGKNWLKMHRYTAYGLALTVMVHVLSAFAGHKFLR